MTVIMKNHQKTTRDATGQDASGWIVRLSLPLPSLQDNTADVDRLRHALQEELDAAEVVLTGITPTPPNPTISKVGRNKDQRVPWRSVGRPEAALEDLKAKGYWIAALEITDDCQPYYAVDYPQRVALVLGHEDHGVTRACLAPCDAAGFVPARASVPIVAAAAPIAGERWQGAWSTALRDGRRHTSPNAGLPEAAFAGAIGVRLGGPNVYHGRRVEKPWIGGALPDADETAVPRAVRLMTVAAALGFGGFWILRIVVLATG